MARRRPFLLRLDEETLSALQVWAADDLRSVNAQVEFLLRQALRQAGRLPTGVRPRGRPSTAQPGQDDSADETPTHAGEP